MIIGKIYRCDECGKEQEFKNKEEYLAKGWDWHEDTNLCEKCSEIENLK